MEDIQVTLFKGFSSVKEETSLLKINNAIRNDSYIARLTEGIEQALVEGNKEKAERTKKQLPFCTVMATYHQVRQSYSIKGYTPIITIDIDALTDEQVVSLRPIIEADSATLHNFLTAKRHGYKIQAYLQTPEAERLRKVTFSAEEITYTQLDTYHRRMYELCRAYYEKLLGVEVDASGKDIGRGILLAHDPDAYLDLELLARITPIRTRIIPDNEEEVKAQKQKRKPQAPQGSAVATIVPDDIPAWDKSTYKKAVVYTRKREKFALGNRDVFLFTLGNRCYAKGLSESTAQILAQQDFGSEPDIDVAQAIHNAYTYIDHTRTEQEKQEEKVPIAQQILTFLDTHYNFRHNTVMDRLEYSKPGDSENSTPAEFFPIHPRDYNSIFLNLQLSGIHCYQTMMRSFIDSDYAREFNPFVAYFRSLPQWDGKTDYIGQLADTVETTDQDFWRTSLKRWLVGTVACALYDDIQNQLVLLLYSEQGKGKSTWIRRLIPPELKEYYCNKIIDSTDKDEMLTLSTHLFINLDEFETDRPGSMTALKRIISQDYITERKVYDTQTAMYIRRASFIASTNNRNCLLDSGGNRRFLTSELKKIDYRASINYEGIYSQAVTLLDNGYRYWYEGEEIALLNERNEQHRMKDPVEENLYIYFRPATDDDPHTKWKPAAGLLTTLNVYGRIQSTKQALLILTQILERDGFKKRLNEHKITEYAVVEFTQHEIEENSKQKQKGETDATAEQEIKKIQKELPF